MHPIICPTRARYYDFLTPPTRWLVRLSPFLDLFTRHLRESIYGIENFDLSLDNPDRSAAKIFITSLPAALTPHIHSIKISLHGSLAATGMGHMTPHSVLLGLMGEDPESVEVGRLGRVLDETKGIGQVVLGVEGGGRRVKLDLDKDLVSASKASCPNGFSFNRRLTRRAFYSSLPDDQDART